MTFSPGVPAGAVSCRAVVVVVVVSLLWRTGVVVVGRSGFLGLALVFQRTGSHM